MAAIKLRSHWMLGGSLCLAIFNIALATDTADIAAKLRKEVDSRKSQLKAFRDFADSIDHERSIGTAFNDIGLTESTCYSIGTLLGRGQEVAKLQTVEQGDLTTRTPDNAYKLRISAQTLDNFAHAATSALAMSTTQKAQTWNLDCVGRFGISLSSREKVAPSTLSVELYANVLWLIGDVEKGFADQMIDAIQKNPTAKTIALGGAGDSMEDAIRAGRFLRDHHFDTTLWNSCYAACPFVFMGGVKRTIWSPYPVVGFHQMVGRDGKALQSRDTLYANVATYVDMMGVDSRLIINAMLDSPPSSMTVIEGHEEALCETRFATWIQRGCSAE